MSVININEYYYHSNDLLQTIRQIVGFIKTLKYLEKYRKSCCRNEKNFYSKVKEQIHQNDINKIKENTDIFIYDLNVPFTSLMRIKVFK